MAEQPLIPWRKTVAAVLTCALCALLLAVAGCTQTSTAGAVAAAASTAVEAVKAATQPASTAPTVSPAALARQPLAGRWILSSEGLDADNIPTTEVSFVLIFKPDGTFAVAHPAGNGQTVYVAGTFKTSGNSLTTTVGKTHNTTTFKITGSELSLINPKTHKALTYHRG